MIRVIVAFLALLAFVGCLKNEPVKQRISIVVNWDDDWDEFDWDYDEP
jgi:hypothetical protein